MFVDSFVYGAHTTMADFLFSGVPSLTIGAYGVDEGGGGAAMPSRVGRSLIRNLEIGGDELMVVDSVKGLEDVVGGLDGDGEILMKMRRMVVSAILTKGT